MIRFLHWLLRGLMRRVEEAMIRRLLRQREEAWADVDRYRQQLGMRLGEFLPDEEAESRSAGGS